MPQRACRAGPALVVWLGPLACALGMVLWRTDRALPWSRFAETLVLALAALVLAAMLRRLAGWRWADALAGVWCAALAFFAGPLPVAATALLAAAALAVGSLLVAQRTAADAAVALAAGLALVAGGLGWLLPYPLHHRLVYLAAALALCIARRAALRAALRHLRQGWRSAADAAPALASVAVMLAGLASTGAWLPTMQADDLAYHLGLPARLQHHHAYAPDPAQQIWALAPWLGDVVQAFAQVVAGGEARGAVDALWLALAAASLGLLATALRPDARLGWLVAALFASQPLLAALAAGMQTELPAAALLAALALVVVRAGAGDMQRALLAGAALAGGLFALKFGQAVAALAMLAWAAARTRRLGGAPSRLAAAAAVFVLVGGSSYFYAWQASGNPMLPLFNEVFRSPVMPAQPLADTRWHAGVDALLPWRITFDTARYLEASAGAFGFALVMLGGAWLVALRRHETRGLALAASAVLLLPLLAVQYARYAFPGLALLLPALAIAGDAALGARRFAALALALCALNLAFQGNAPWPTSTIARKRLLGTGGDAAYVLERFAPERVLIADLRRRDADDSIVLALDAQAPYVAELAGRGRTVAWYAPALEAERRRADEDPSGARWRRLIDGSGARWLLLRPARLGEAQRAALAAGGAQRVAAAGEAELWAWPRTRAGDGGAP